MKYIKLIIVSLICIIPLKAYAFNGSINITCNNTTLNVNKSTTCTLSGYSSEEVSAISAKLTSSGNITIENIKTNPIWQGNGDDGAIELYTDVNKKNNFQIATFTVKATSNEGSGIINVNNIKFSDANFNENNISNNNLNIIVNRVHSNNTSNNTPIKSNDATLKTLIINNKSITLQKNIFEYSIDVENDILEIVIESKANNNNAKIQIPKDLKLNIGKNKFEIIVIAENGTKKTYIINVTRLEKKQSNNAKLSELIIEGVNLNFNSDVYSYELGNITTNSLKISYKTEDSNASVEIYGNENIGKNDVVIIKVTAENGNVSNYQLFINNISNVDNNLDDKVRENVFSNIFVVILTLLFSVIIGYIIYYFNKRKNEI